MSNSPYPSSDRPDGLMIAMIVLWIGMVAETVSYIVS